MPDAAWKLYSRTGDTWDGMYADCAAARESIDIEQFIFSDDAAGRRFFDVLRRKKKEGVAIRIMCDGVGSYGLLNSRMEKLLLAEGISIKFFNPIRPWRVGNISSWFLRDHRKMLLVDRSIAYTGGSGIEGRMEDWRDTNVRITGAVVGAMQAAFDHIWNSAGRYKISKFAPAPKPGEPFSFLTNSPRFRRRYIYHELRRTIRKAQKYIYLTSPYFVPSILLFAALVNAARRGVDVRILLPTASDVGIANIATGSYILLALNASIKIYLYDSERILHAKTGVVDDTWATVGSANIDNLSLLLNFEGNIKSSDPAFIADLKRQFIDDLDAAKMLTEEEWARRPLSLKFLEMLTWPLHGIL